ncbi:MAG: hypothetical protein WCI67_01355 [Chloroflexales bacterium]
MSSQANGDAAFTPTDTNSHLSVLALLPEYVTRLALGQRPRQEWRPLERHLEQCAACRAEADTLRQHMVETYTGTLPAAPEPPPPELPFLSRRPARPTAPEPPRPQAGRPAPSSYRVQVSAALLPQMQVHLAARSGDLRLRYTYAFPAADERDPAVTLEVLSADSGADRGTARICVELADRSPFDQAGSRVTLSSGQVKISGVTDPGGTVIFTDVALDTIAEWQIYVEPQAEDDRS